jgi:hypothetical protein
MKIFQASLFLRVLKRYYEMFPDDPLDVLLSLAYNQSERNGFLVKYRHMIDAIIGDSGAWSFAQGKSDITLEELIAVLNICGEQFTRYFNFDTDFRDKGFENNIANQIIMEKAGLYPVPVIHNFFDKEIEYYVKSGKYDWLALGSSQSTNFDDIRYAVDRIITWGDPNIRIHWFGGSKFEWLAKLPIAACDTSSWAKTGQFGYIRYWNPHEEKFNKTHNIFVSGRLKEFKKGEYHFVTYPWRRELEEYLDQNLNLTYSDLCGYDEKFNMQLVNTRFYSELAKKINKERVKRGIVLE